MWGPPQIQQAAADRGCSEATRDDPGTDRGRKDTSNRLDFSINNGGVLTTVLVDPADYFWFQNQWVHIRITWDTAAPLGDQVRLYFNGIEPPHTDPVNPYDSSTMIVGFQAIGLYFGSPANGAIDEFHVYGGSATTPTQLANGGLTSSSSEYLADTSSNFPLSFALVDGTRRGEYLYFGSDSKFRGLNVALSTAGSGASPDLQWQYWNGSAWADLEIGFGFTDETVSLTQDGTVYWTGDPAGWSHYSVSGGPDLFYVRAYLASGDYAAQAPVEGLIKTDIALLLDVTASHDNRPSWLSGTEVGGDGTLRFRAEAGRSYLAVTPEAVYRPVVRKPTAGRLKSKRSEADYLLIAPREFLPVTQPLLELRRNQGLTVKAVTIEDIYSEFGFGEPTPQAVKDFLSYAYHHWEHPSLRYVVLFGDATYDYKDYLGTGVSNQVPPLMVKTRYLWTTSDPTYAAVNGDDLLPDLAIGRLPAATVVEARQMVEKILAYEGGEASLREGVVLVADDADRAGNFEADANELASTVLASRNPKRIYLSQLGAGATQDAILEAFDEGASLMSYLGHGGIHLWASENVFNIWDVPSLTPQPQTSRVFLIDNLLAAIS